jgi:hypothetical protein
LTHRRIAIRNTPYEEEAREDLHHGRRQRALHEPEDDMRDLQHRAGLHDGGYVADGRVRARGAGPEPMKFLREGLTDLFARTRRRHEERQKLPDERKNLGDKRLRVLDRLLAGSDGRLGCRGKVLDGEEEHV